MPDTGNRHQLTREELAAIGWRMISATSTTRDLRETRGSAVDDILRSIDLGAERGELRSIADQIQIKLKTSPTLGRLRGKLTTQLSKALPELMQRDDLTFVPGTAAQSRGRSLSASTQPELRERIRRGRDVPPHDMAYVVPPDVFRPFHRPGHKRADAATDDMVGDSNHQPAVEGSYCVGLEAGDRGWRGQVGGCWSRTLPASSPSLIIGGCRICVPSSPTASPGALEGV